QAARSPRSFDDRRVEQLSLERDGAEALRSRSVERRDDPTGMLDLRRRRAEDLVDRLDLVRMNARFARVAHSSCTEGVASEAFAVFEVGPDAVQRETVRGCGGDSHGGPRVCQ